MLHALLHLVIAAMCAPARSLRQDTAGPCELYITFVSVIELHDGRNENTTPRTQEIHGQETQR